MRRFVAFMVLLVIGAFLNAPPLAGINSDFCFMNNTSTTNTAIDVDATSGALTMIAAIDVNMAGDINAYNYLPIINENIYPRKAGIGVGVHPGDRYAVELRYNYLVSGTTSALTTGVCLGIGTTSGAATHFDYGTVMRC